MVTPAGKEMLKNTINTVKLHNRILEENEMWRHWYMEKGLTMMVSDDLIRKDKAFSAMVERAARKSKKRKKRHKEKHKRNKHGSRESRHSSKNGCTKVANSSADRWDHSGFEELYPETKAVVKNDSSEVKRCLKDGTKPSSSNTSPSADSDSSDSKEIWEEFKLFKKRKRKNSDERVSKFRKYDDSDSDQGTCKKHRGDETTSKKKRCEGSHCHHKHKRKGTKHTSCKHC